MTVSILSFYSFVNIEDLDVLKQKLLCFCKKKLIRGTILIAPEGFNGSLSGRKEDLDEFLVSLVSWSGAVDVISKYNFDTEHPFSKMKVKIKTEIIKIGINDLDVANQKGEYILSSDWDDFISQEDVVVVDTRNDYEIGVGTFKGAIDPKTSRFSDFPKWVEDNGDLLKDKKIAMFCTGGVRCEKSTAFLRKVGYDSVYHLKGGILQYLEDTRNVNSNWTGECFVFDDRVAVNDNLESLMIDRPDRSYKKFSF